MSKLHFTTKHANAATVQRNWYVVDGTNQTVGRMCARIAAVLRGKNKAYYTPHVDCWRFRHCNQLRQSQIHRKQNGRKSLRSLTLVIPVVKKKKQQKTFLRRRPEVIIERAVKGMLPKESSWPQDVQKIICVCRC